jgi:carboxyl-terminal processing protease
MPSLDPDPIVARTTETVEPVPTGPPETEAADPTHVAAASDPSVAYAPGYTAPGAAPRRRRISALPLAVALVAVLAGGALFMSGYSLGNRSIVEPGTPASQADAFRPFWDTYGTITERYAAGAVDRDALIQGAIRGMINALGDPYSSYLTSEEYRQSLQGISGQFEGIGAEIDTKADDGTQGCPTLGPACRLVIVSPIDGSPAQKAGLHPGDLVLATDGESLDGLDVESARGRIRGPKGTVVTLTVQRDGGESMKIAVTRDIIQQKEVTSRDLAGGAIGYVRLSGFSDRGAVELRDAVKAHVDAGRKGLILDLRGNPGGYVTAARAIASEFIASGPIFWEEDAKGHQDPTPAAPGGVATDPSIRLVVLIDRGSASASEIVAGALQDTERATLVGETSFGKGTVQQWQELSGEGGAFRLTVAKWLTPNKRWIHDVGLVPDVAVTAPADPTGGTDPVLDKAVEVLGSSAGSHALSPAA